MSNGDDQQYNCALGACCGGTTPEEDAQKRGEAVEEMMIHDLVELKELPSAVRLNSTGRQLGQLFGPAVGGLLMLWFGPAMGLVVNAVIYLPLTIWLIRAPYTGHLQPGRAARRVRWSEAFSVIRDVADNRPVVTMVVLGGAASLFIGNAFQAAMPEFAHDLGTTGADFTYSALLGANAAGAVVGGILLDATGWLLPTVRSAIVCAMLWCGAIAHVPPKKYCWLFGSK